MTPAKVTSALRSTIFVAVCIHTLALVLALVLGGVVAGIVGGEDKK